VQERPNGTTHLEMRLATPKPKDVAFVDQIALRQHRATQEDFLGR